MAYLAHISIYPVKSLAPFSLPQTILLAGGALEHDREFALFSEDGKFLNAKRTLKIHDLRSSFDLISGTLHLQATETGLKGSFPLPDDMEALERWLTCGFDQPVFVRHRSDGGFPDDLNAPGPTVISTAKLEEVASWFPGLSIESARTRFRANLEIGGVPPFWEDQLFGEPDTLVPFQIGSAVFHGVNPCQRCVVPPRDPETGEVIPDFSPIFRAKREETLPAWAVRARFNHFYRLAVNTRVPSAAASKTLHIGDSVRLLPVDAA